MLNVQSSKLVDGALDDARLKIKRSKQKVKSVKAEIKEYIWHWCGETTSHGLPKIIKSKYFITRVLWIITFLAGFGYGLYTAFTAVIQYSQNGVTTSVTVTQDHVTEFPTITICNMNPFNEKIALEDGYLLKKSGNGIDCLKNLNSRNVNDSLLKSLMECYKTNDTSLIFKKLVDTMRRVIANDDLSDDDKMLKLGYDLSADMLISCNFNGQECSESNFTRFWHNIYGSCYTFNGDQHAVTNRRGKNYGLHLELVVDSPNPSLFRQTNGLYVVVTNQTHQLVTLSNGINIAPGYETYVAVSREFRSNLPSPYSNCIKDLTPFSDYSSKLFQHFAELNVNQYDQELCLNLCYQDQLIQSCNCTDIITPPIGVVNYCQTNDEIECMQNFDFKFSSLNTNQQCNSVCEPSCSTQTLLLSNHQAFFPTYTYLSFIASNKWRLFPLNAQTDAQNENFARKAFLRLVINYDTLAYTTLQDSPTTTANQFLGTFGANLNLFLGFSALTFVELIELVIVLILIYFRKKIKKKSKSSSTAECISTVEENKYLRSRLPLLLHMPQYLKPEYPKYWLQNTEFHNNPINSLMKSENATRHRNPVYNNK